MLSLLVYFLVGCHIPCERVDGAAVVDDHHEQGELVLCRHAEQVDHAAVLRAALAHEDNEDAVVNGGRGDVVLVDCRCPRPIEMRSSLAGGAMLCMWIAGTLTPLPLGCVKFMPVNLHNDGTTMMPPKRALTAQRRGGVALPCMVRRGWWSTTTRRRRALPELVRWELSIVAPANYVVY